MQIGIVLNTYRVEPETERPADVEAARRIDGLQNRIFIDPVLRGTYPVDVVDDVKRSPICPGARQPGWSGRATWTRSVSRPTCWD